MRKSYLKKMATKSFVGRVLRRLLGEEKGAVMMEYIVIALLIATAAVIAISAFGQTATQMFAALGAAMTGDHETAKQAQETAQKTMAAGADASDGYITNQHSAKSNITPTPGNW